MKNILDSELISKLKYLVQEERNLTLEILHYFREVESRRLYAQLAYSSMHEFCVKELGYSSGAAWRRIESMRLLKELPKVESKILSGELNLSVLSKVQTIVKQERKSGNAVSIVQKEALLDGLCGKSTREVEKSLVEQFPNQAPKFKERIEPISGEATAIKIVADRELMELLDQVRSLSGVPGEDIASIFKKLARSYIAKKTVRFPPLPTTEQSAGVER